ncbi:hypothetical protein BJV82DRAFT_292898, partial [Fennellomyces sp. T-0311]
HKTSSVKRTYSTIITKLRYYNNSGEQKVPQKGHLGSGEIYKQGSDHFPSNKGHQLHKEVHRVSATLDHIQQIQQLIPYDIWSHIFRYLDSQDLLRCASVSETWCSFIASLPEFWQQLPVQLPLLATGSVIDPQASTGQIQELILSDHVNINLMNDILMFLVYWRTSSVQKLSISKAFHSISTWTDKSVDLLAQALQSLDTSVQVEFIDCMIPSDKVLSPLLESCANLGYVSFSQLNLPATNYSAPPLRQLVVPDIGLLSLTYLKLSFEYATYAGDGPIKEGLLCGIFCKCPNLEHLFLDSNGGLHQPECISQALKHCPRLKNLVMNSRAEMPASVMSAIEDHEIHPLGRPGPDSIRVQVNGLQRLVLGCGKFDLDQVDIGAAFTDSYRSLKYIYLNYGRIVGPSALSILADHGALNLQEICVATNLYYQNTSAITSLPTHRVLPALFSRCPNLQVIVLYDAHSAGFHKSADGVIEGDSEVMKVIAEHCLQLHHLRIIGGWHRQTLDSLLYFA